MRDPLVSGCKKRLNGTETLRGWISRPICRIKGAFYRSGRLAHINLFPQFPLRKNTNHSKKFPGHTGWKWWFI
jgi:hypothetical protein